MRHVLTVLLAVFLIGSVMGGEAERKARVQALIKQLADESFENRKAAYAELRDTFVRKRDIPELTKEIARENANPHVKVSLQELITFMEGRWRLPDKGWTNDTLVCLRYYEDAFEDFGCQGVVGERSEFLPKPLATLDLVDAPIGAKNRTGVINLILTLEPEILSLWETWTDITFLGTLANLEQLTLEHTGVTDLTLLKGMQNLKCLNLQETGVTDLTPLKGLPNLSYLYLGNTGVTDLTPLKGLSNLRCLELQNTKVTDLMPLKGLPGLYHLNLRNTGVTDLTPLEGLPNLSYLYLDNTKVTDLTPLKGLPDLWFLTLDNTKVTDLTPLKGLPRLWQISLRNTGVTDLTPLEGMKVTIVKKQD